jgi:hypothetical protein
MVVHRALRAQVLSVLLLRCSSFQLVMLAYFFRVQVLVDDHRTIHTATQTCGLILHVLPEQFFGCDRGHTASADSTAHCSHRRPRAECDQLQYGHQRACGTVHSESTVVRQATTAPVARCADVRAA